MIHGDAPKVERNISATDTGRVIYAGRCNVSVLSCSYNAGAGTGYFKFYNKATAPTATDTPVMTVAIPFGNHRDIEFPAGLRFNAGLSVRATTAVADNSTAGVVAGSAAVSAVFTPVSDV